MRLKTFQAKNIGDALNQIRTELGREAIIVSTTELKDGVQVTAAVKYEGNENQEVISAPQSLPAPNQHKKKPEVIKTLDLVNSIYQICAHHRLTENFRDSWLEVLSPMMTQSSNCLDASLQTLIPINPQWINSLHFETPVVLVGPAGSGKTVAFAKLAAHLLSMGKKVKAVTTDCVKAGAIAQAKVYFEAMGQEIIKAPNKAALSKIFQNLERDEIMLVDTPATNIYNTQSMNALHNLVTGIPCSLTVVLPALMDAQEASDQAKAYKTLNAKQIIISQMDNTSHYGSIVTAPFESGLELACYSASPNLGDGLFNFNPSILTRIFFESIPEQKAA